VAKAAVIMALSSDREEERALKASYLRNGVRVVAVDFGGEFLTSMTKMVERGVVASKREEVISDTHWRKERFAGATREAVSQIMPKAVGLNVGGKIGIARSGEHIAVAVFFGIGLLHLNEVAIGLGHRAI
jgi:hypothetical protein